MSRIERGILEGLKQAVSFERGEGTARVRTYTADGTMVADVPAFPSRRVAALRKRLKLSQTVFAGTLGVSPETVKAWEQGKRDPDGTARRLLQVAEIHPAVLLNFLIARKPSAGRKRPRAGSTAKRVHATP